MNRIRFPGAALVVSLALLWFLPPARAQSASGAKTQPSHCTDLSGKIPLPCPSSDEQATDSAATDESATVPAKPDAGTPSGVRVPHTRRSVAPSAAAETKPATGQPETTVVRTTGEPSPAPAPDPRASIGLHPRTPPDPESMEEQPRAVAVRTTVAPQPSGAAPDPRASIGLYPKTPPEPEPSPVASSSPASRPSRSPELSLVRNLVQDQKDIWTSPLHLRFNDFQWLAPLLAVGTVTTLSDTDIERHLPTSVTLQTRSKNYSTYGMAAFAGATGAAWLLGRATNNDHLRETGILGGEAALDSFALTYAIKGIAQRDRPFQGSGHGTFFSNGDSFPSEHAAAAWSMATVIAHEYPGPLTTIFAYGGAAAVSAMRVTARQHFTSDALVGSALGYFVGRHVYNAHHDRGELARYGTFEHAPAAETPRTAANTGSAFVPLDSWVYAAFDRLEGLGYIHTAFAGLRPWTRLECVRLLDEAELRIETSTTDNEGFRLFRSLQAEFALDAESITGGNNVGAELESIYTRFTGISGKPLNDSYHFGQTAINDYGRPYQEGFNSVSGFTARAEAGPFAFYVRGEYQHSPSAPAYSLPVRQAIATADGNPLQPAIPFAAHDDFQLLDTYVALNIKNNQFSFGRQTLWWGPGVGGALMFSNNALPFYSLRWSQVSPFKLPSIFGFLGPMRTDFFIGKLDGHQFPTNPFISGQKISFKPTPNLELGFSKISVFAGGNTPLAWNNFYKATFSVNDRGPGADLPGNDPGDRRSGFDFRYRIPGLRNWLTLYNDSLSDDDPSPFASPRRAAMNPGIYLSHVPGLPKLDFRAEAAYTDVPGGPVVKDGSFIYYNGRYHDSHTNAGNLMGSWVGREGRGLQLFSTYWFSPQNTLQVGYRSARVAGDFLNGGTLTDVSGRASIAMRPDLFLTGSVQYERWDFPLLAPSQQRNTSASIQITFRPQWRKP